VSTFLYRELKNFFVPGFCLSEDDKITRSVDIVIMEGRKFLIHIDAYEEVK